MINPTLFIGLGSTGKKIIEQLQLLVLEEYGVPRLPIFNYLVFETDRGNAFEVPLWVNNEIELVRPTVTNTDAIRQEIEQGEREYYKDWLDESVLNVPGGQFTQGAGSIRMAGRLCLWENWSHLAQPGDVGGGCATAIKNAQDRFAGPNVQATQQLLAQLYARWGKPVPAMGVPIANEPNVYIVGTLCGGTCGGMFIDVAYYVKQIFGLYRVGVVGAPLAKVMGVFTVYDSGGLGGALNAGGQREAANCWASLLEYDYYCHPTSRYEVVFPDGLMIDTHERPLDYAYVLSCSGNGVDVHRPDGTADEDSLAHMAAMVLFSESVEGPLGARDAIRISSACVTRAHAPDANEHMAALATCGLATVWYPKLRITESACCKYVLRLCLDGIGAAPGAKERTLIAQEARVFWGVTYEAARTELFKAPEGTTIADLVDGVFATQHQHLMRLSAAEREAELGRLLNDLGQGRLYDQLLNDPRVHETVGQQLSSAVESATAAALAGAGSVRRAQEFLEELDKAIARTVTTLPRTYPAPDRGWVLERGLLTRLARKTGAVAVERCQAEVKACAEKIRDYRMTGILETLREKIGVGVQLPDGAVMAGAMSLSQRLTSVEQTLKACVGDLSARQAQVEVAVQETQDTWLITDSGSVSGDAAILFAKLEALPAAEKADILARAMVHLSLDQFLGLGEAGLTPAARISAICDPLLAAVREEAIRQVGSFNIAQRLRADPQARAGRLCAFVKGARPHLELHGDLIGAHGFSCEFMMGRDDNVNVPHMTALNGALQQCPDPVTFWQNAIKHVEELDHLLLFYKEEALIYMDENLMTANRFAAEYRDCESVLAQQPAARAITRTTHTHKLGGSFFWKSRD